MLQQLEVLPWAPISRRTCISCSSCFWHLQFWKPHDLSRCSLLICQSTPLGYAALLLRCWLRLPSCFHCHSLLASSLTLCCRGALNVPTGIVPSLLVPPFCCPLPAFAARPVILLVPPFCCPLLFFALDRWSRTRVPFQTLRPPFILHFVVNQTGFIIILNTYGSLDDSLFRWSTHNYSGVPLSIRPPDLNAITKLRQCIRLCSMGSSE
mmetsp:Transcript_35095/g.58121  ORF Transcript_35095/g.58121 Transcript_35095/m.58121 type:complete len:209 (+) Transcript_35095:666-1292(+)